MDQKLLVVLLSFAVLQGCSHFIDNDEHAYLRESVRSTPNLVMPEGVHQPELQPYMPLPEGATEYPATKENVDFQPPVDVS